MTGVLGINEDSHITVTTVVRACKSRQQTRKKGEHRGNYLPRFPLMGPVSRKARDQFLESVASNMIQLSVSETKWSSLLARTRALILYISISIFDFGPEKLPGLSRNGSQVTFRARKHILKSKPVEW